MKDRPCRLRLELWTITEREGHIHPSKHITQNMAYWQSPMKYAEEYSIRRLGRNDTKAGLTSASGRCVGTGLELWHRLPQRGYAYRLENLFRMMR